MGEGKWLFDRVKSEERLTMRFLARGTVNCCSLHLWPFGEWIEMVSGWMVYCEMLLSVVWIESRFIWPELTRSALLKNPLIGNDSLLIGFLQTPLSPTNLKQSLYLSVCVSRKLSCLVSLIIQVNFLFSLSQSVSLFNLGAVLEWWVFICLESLSIPRSLSVSLIFKV